MRYAGADQHSRRSTQPSTLRARAVGIKPFATRLPRLQRFSSFHVRSAVRATQTSSIVCQRKKRSWPRRCLHTFKGTSERSVDIYRRIVASWQDLPQARCGIGVCVCARARCDEAEQAFPSSHERHPNFPPDRRQRTSPRHRPICLMRRSWRHAWVPSRWPAAMGNSGMTARRI